MTKPSQLPPELAAVVERLRALGATVTWPSVPSTSPARGTAIPLPMVGQVWSTHRSGIQARAILEIGPHPTWSEPVVWFVVPGDDAPMPRHIGMKSWRAWARRHGTRPAVDGTLPQ